MTLDQARRMSPLEPVVIEITQTCHFKAKGCKTCGKAKTNTIHKVSAGIADAHSFRKQLGCANCGGPKNARQHMGSPPSLNVLGSGNQMAYIGLKKQWEELLFDLLSASELPRDLARVVVEGEATFPDRARRDQGNFRVLLEKALGDTLTAGAWLDDDDWSRYEFGQLTYRHEPGVSRTRLILFPTAGEPTMEAAA